MAIVVKGVKYKYATSDGVSICIHSDPSINKSISIMMFWRAGRLPDEQTSVPIEGDVKELIESIVLL